MVERPLRFGWQDLVVLVAFECVAVPICIASGEAFVSEHYARAFSGWFIGIPLAIAGFTPRWWKDWLSDEVRQRVFSQAERWWPAAVFLAFIYVTGPEIYRRATGPKVPISSPEISAPAVPLPSSSSATSAPAVSQPAIPPPTTSAPSVPQPLSPDVDISGDIKLLRNEQLRAAAYTVATRIESYSIECSRRLSDINSSALPDTQKVTLQIQLEQNCDRQYREKLAPTFAKLNSDVRRRLNLPVADSKLPDHVITWIAMSTQGRELLAGARKLP